MIGSATSRFPPDSMIRAGTIAAATLGIGIIHEITPASYLHSHEILQHLYYLPVVVAGLIFGWPGALVSGAFAALTHAPYIISTWHVDRRLAIDDVIEIPVVCMAGLVAGILATREQKQRHHLEQTTALLASVYRELQENVDRMKRAERLYALGQLSAGLAHEIRNPLASIAGAVGLLERHGAAEESCRELIEIKKKENERLTRLLTTFLDFARPRAPKYYTIDIPGALNSAIDLAAHAVDHKPIRLGGHAEPGLPLLECDPEQLKQVLLNLLINAVQAMPDGGEILLSAREQHGKALIQVRDEGCGIAQEDCARIFDPFFTTKDAGTGLGLSVAQQIVEQHGGTITAQRNPDRGMTFSVLLPFERGSPA